MALRLVTHAERPELRELAPAAEKVWPEYNLHGDVMNEWWGARSLLITGSVADWERWTEMVFPESGEYVFPHGLAPLSVDRDAGVGTYWEPNVWMVHPELG
jgi:hypothetical protein